MATTTKYGFCPVCGSSNAVKANGDIYSHGRVSGFKAQCSGSGQKALTLEEVVEQVSDPAYVDVLPKEPSKCTRCQCLRMYHRGGGQCTQCKWCPTYRKVLEDV